MIGKEMDRYMFSSSSLVFRAKEIIDWWRLGKEGFPFIFIGQGKEALGKGLEGGSLFCTTHQLELGFGFALAIGLGKHLQFGVEFWQRGGVRLKRKKCCT